MNKLTLTVKRLLSCSLLSGAALLASPALLYAQSSTDLNQPAASSIAERYQSGISKAAQEIAAAKAHRTALALRMHEITSKLEEIESGKKVLLQDETQPVAQGIASINHNIESLAQKISDENTAYQQQKLMAEQLPVPSLLEDALGSNDARAQHRAMALQNYRLYQTKKSVDRSRQQQQHLLSRKVALALKSKALQADISEVRDDLTDLKDNRRLLEAKFTDLSSTIVKKQDRLQLLQRRMKEQREQPQKARFSYHQGKLLEPAKGVLQHRYNQPKAKGLLKWEGITIETAEGESIEAVFDGTVVFADQMQGLGYVAILDHGEGYMSLYGMADFLIVEPGQTVLIGEPIGTVGGYDENGNSTLYFEIRHNADTLNPQDWLAFRQISHENQP